MRLSKDTGEEKGDSLEELQKGLPTVDPALIREVVTSIMDFPPESNLGKRERETAFANNQCALLDSEVPDTDPATLSILTQDPNDASMVTTPKKGSAEELQFINKND